MRNLFTRAYCLADFCENYIDKISEETVDEQIYDACCDYLRDCYSQKQEILLRNYFNIQL